MADRVTEGRHRATAATSDHLRVTPGGESRRRHAQQARRRTRRRVSSFTTLTGMMIAQIMLFSALAVWSPFSFSIRALLAAYALYAGWAAVFLVQEMVLAYREVAITTQERSSAQNSDDQNLGERDTAADDSELRHDTESEPSHSAVIGEPGPTLPPR